MVNYGKSIIYKLCCKDTDITDIYVGSTTNFNRRKGHHKSSCNNETCKDYQLPKYQFIRNNGGFENWDMIMIEQFSCDTKLELHKKERECVDLLKPSLNRQPPVEMVEFFEIDCDELEFPNLIIEENKDNETVKYIKNNLKIHHTYKTVSKNERPVFFSMPGKASLIWERGTWFC